MDSDKKNNKTNKWLIIGVIVLIGLLLLWLSVADLLGDTDVAAFISPAIALRG
ncbi:MAG: hypothetical protein NC102_03955 [Clostridium sp.]|nr:hypothetical protein [Clostridium sp.]